MAKKKSFPLRVDPDLYEDLRRWADAELRSVNGQIEYLLREAVDRRFGRTGRNAPAPAGAGAEAGASAEAEAGSEAEAEAEAAAGAEDDAFGGEEGETR